MPQTTFHKSGRMLAIEDQVTQLDDRLDDLRGATRYGIAVATPEIRVLRCEIGKLMKEYWEISAVVNAKWHAQEPVWKKRFK